MAGRQHRRSGSADREGATVSDPMQRGRFATPVRCGETIERVPGPAARNVHALLTHLERQGFPLSPRPLGMTGEGREILSFLPGDTGYPPLTDLLRSDETLVSVARAVRALHDATQGFVAPEPGRWHRMELAVPAVIDCIGHHDLAPWNFVFDDGGEVAGILDWDTAGPSNRVWDLAYAFHHLVPFHPPDGLAGFGWTREPDRARRLRLFTDAYGRDIRPEQVVDLAALRLMGMAAYIDVQVQAADPAFAVHRDERHADGYRAAAAYILTHRDDLLDDRDHR
ncbi:phosphotransferase enzyme family protein [Actinoplanes philippinensis]|uniref:phosphotransferase enzyme family protein n=1 Tax=Actinoplanes philippinensis TaxID=35752 RepID=UPI0033E49371